MTSTPVFHASLTQPDEALRLLAEWYERLSRRAPRLTSASMILAQLSDLCLHARDLQDARAQALALIPAAPAEPEVRMQTHFAEQAVRLLEQLIAAHGDAHVLIAGVTDGVHHLCLRCANSEYTPSQPPFFEARARRWLLTPEITWPHRLEISRCQTCLQVLAPLKLVLGVWGGTMEHATEGNQAGKATLLDLYECNRETQAVQLPRLLQIAAPSRQLCLERAHARCWKEGWYWLPSEPQPSLAGDTTQHKEEAQ